jgi:surface polysaccharide O-acyltransferase-like enzyme
MLHKAVKYALTVLSDASLSYVSDILSGVIRNTKKEINSTPFEILTVLAFFYFGARYLLCNTCPVGKGAFDTSACISVHKEEIYVFSS